MTYNINKINLSELVGEFKIHYYIEVNIFLYIYKYIFTDWKNIYVHWTNVREKKIKIRSI